MAERLGISVSEASRHITYHTHFFSVYDLTHRDEGGDVSDYIAEDCSNVPPAEIIYCRLKIECLRESFYELPKKERDILGKRFGVFRRPKMPLREIAMYHLMKEDAVEKARTRTFEETAEWVKEKLGVAVEGGTPSDRTGRSLRRTIAAGLAGLVGA